MSTEISPGDVGFYVAATYVAGLLVFGWIFQYLAGRESDGEKLRETAGCATLLWPLAVPLFVIGRTLSFLVRSGFRRGQSRRLILEQEQEIVDQRARNKLLRDQIELTRLQEATKELEAELAATGGEEIP